MATDNLAGGVLAGEFLAEQLEPGDTVAVLEGVAGAPSLEDRVTGFEEGLGDDFEIVASLPTDCDQTKGLDAAQDILTANPDVTAIYGACGPPIIGALEAIDSAGKDIIVVGFDAGPDEVAAIVAGDQLASVAQFPARMGELGAQAALDAINGEPVEPTSTPAPRSSPRTTPTSSAAESSPVPRWAPSPPVRRPPPTRPDQLTSSEP